jgi:hypothetical protein
VLVLFDHVASGIVNADHRIVRATVMLCVPNRIADRVRPALPQPTERQHVGNQIDAAFIFARVDFVSVHCLMVVFNGAVYASPVVPSVPSRIVDLVFSRHRTQSVHHRRF